MPCLAILVALTVSNAAAEGAAGGASAAADSTAADVGGGVAPDSAAAVVEFPVPLASFTTTLIGSLPNRTRNIRLAAAALDGQVLDPGVELSFNEVVGPRT